MPTLVLENGNSRDGATSTSTAISDALSYVDRLSDREKRAAENLIDEEMKRSTKRPADYLHGMKAMTSLSFPVCPYLLLYMCIMKFMQMI